MFWKKNYFIKYLISYTFSSLLLFYIKAGELNALSHKIIPYGLENKHKVILF